MKIVLILIACAATALAQSKCYTGKEILQPWDQLARNNISVSTQTESGGFSTEKKYFSKTVEVLLSPVGSNNNPAMVAARRARSHPVLSRRFRLRPSAARITILRKKQHCFPKCSPNNGRGNDRPTAPVGRRHISWPIGPDDFRSRQSSTLHRNPRQRLD